GAALGGEAEKPVSLGAMRVYAKARRVEAPGRVCLREGVLEYLLVLPDSGKEYESLIVMEGKASSLHAGLLALGARPGPAPAEFGDGAEERKGDKTEPARTGDWVRIRVRLGDDGELKPVEAWLRDRATGKAPGPLEWVFTGSALAPGPDGKRVYVADEDRLVAALWPHGRCVLNVAKAAGVPYRGDRLGYEVNTSALPAEGAKVWVVFELARQSVSGTRCDPCSGDTLPSGQRPASATCPRGLPQHVPGAGKTQEGAAQPEPGRAGK
ncbi:MAG TPA: YdjY domain-containing protein, partial [Candidatus Brocadiia bacterium]|nr:YdjY domain-containing protein [Candidatus Brocadiia bacterium]